MRSDKQDRHARLIELIEDAIAEQPQEFEGQIWAIRPLQDWAELSGLSLATVKRLITIPPIQKTYTQVEGRKAVLLRVGDPAPPTDREIANLMKARFQKKTGRAPDGHAYGCLKGLAQRWPDGAQVEIFQTVLDNWRAFKSAVKFKIDEMLQNGENAKHAFHEYPSIPVILKFHAVAVDLYVMKLQEKGLQPPASVIALNPGIWTHLKGPSEN